MAHSDNGLREHQPPFTVELQIENLKSKGLRIDNDAVAREILNGISYFSLIKAYSLGLKNKQGEYHPNISFEDIVNLYDFNSNFRQAVFSQVEKIEVTLRCRLANYFSQQYGVLGYSQSQNFALGDNDFAVFHDELTREIARNQRKPFIKNFQENYVGGEIPLYALVEIMSFGTLSKFFKNMHSSDKKTVAKEYGVGYTYLESWFENIAYIRNICAHYGRLYNIKVTKPPALYKEYAQLGVRNTTVFATLLAMRSLLPRDTHWSNFVEVLGLLLERYPNVRLDYLGFPENWSVLLGNEA